MAESWLIDWSILFSFSSAYMGISSICVFNTYLSSGYFVSSIVFTLGYYDSEQNCVRHSVSCGETTTRTNDGRWRVSAQEDRQKGSSSMRGEQVKSLDRQGG